MDTGLEVHLALPNDVLLTQLEARYTLYIAAEAAILSGSQSYSIGNRTITLADLENISKMIDRLAAQIRTLSNGNRILVQRVVPRDNA